MMPGIRIRADDRVSYLSIVEDGEGKKLGVIAKYTTNAITFRALNALTTEEVRQVLNEMERMEEASLASTVFHSPHRPYPLHSQEKNPMAESDIRTGKTTKQMLDAKLHAIYVIPSYGMQMYAEKLAKHLGREDLTIVHQSKLSGEILGKSATIIFDHDCS